jgi:hypothetical protein
MMPSTENPLHDGDDSAGLPDRDLSPWSLAAFVVLA